MEYLGTDFRVFHFGIAITFVPTLDLASRVLNLFLQKFLALWFTGWVLFSLYICSLGTKYAPRQNLSVSVLFNSLQISSKTIVLDCVIPHPGFPLGSRNLSQMFWGALSKWRECAVALKRSCVGSEISLLSFVNFVFTKWLRPTHASQKYAIWAQHSPNLPGAVRSLIKWHEWQLGSLCRSHKDPRCDAGFLQVP